MAVYNLVGAGAQGLTSGTSRLLVDVTQFDVRSMVGRATPANYFDLGLLRVGVQGSYGPTRPVDAASMFIDLPQGATTLGYSLFGTTAIRVTEQFGVGGLSSRPAPYDRNPAFVSQQFISGVGGGTALTVQWTYTVPTGRILQLASAHVAVIRYAVAATPVAANAYIDAGAGSYLAYADLRANTLGAEDRDAAIGPIWFTAGQQIRGNYSNTDTGGGVIIELTAVGTLFDA